MGSEDEDARAVERTDPAHGSGPLGAAVRGARIRRARRVGVEQPEERPAGVTLLALEGVELERVDRERRGGLRRRVPEPTVGDRPEPARGVQLPEDRPAGLRGERVERVGAHRCLDPGIDVGLHGGDGPGGKSGRQPPVGANIHPLARVVLAMADRRRLLQLLTVTLAAALARGGSGQEPSAVDRFRADLAALTAPEMAGREPGTPGGARAERFLASRFAAIPLASPDGIDGHLQEFEVEDPRPARVDRDRTQLDVRIGRAAGKASLGSQFVPFGFSPEARASGRVVFAGHGLVIPEIGRNDYRELDVDGAIVLVLRGAPGWREADSPFRTFRSALRFSAKIAAAAEAGAVGFLLADPDGGTFAGGEPALLARAVRARGAASIPAVWIDWETASRILRELGHGAGAAQSGGEDVPRDAAGRVEAELAVGFVERRPPRRTHNVVGFLEGSDPELADEVVVVGAHHDHIGRGEFGSLRPGAAGQIHPGADDNASGCAALLMIAEQLAAGERPRRGVAFVAFGAEELGLRGSQHLLATGPWEVGQIVAMIDLNMIGRATPERLRIEGVGTGAGLAELVAAAGRRVGLSPQTREGASPRSDHAAFLGKRIPALFVHSGLHEEYHTPDDVPERVLVPEAVGAARLTAEIVRALADVDARPEFVEVSAEGFRRREK